MGMHLPILSVNVKSLFLQKKIQHGIPPFSYVYEPYATAWGSRCIVAGVFWKQAGPPGSLRTCPRNEGDQLQSRRTRPGKRRLVFCRDQRPHVSKGGPNRRTRQARGSSGHAIFMTGNTISQAPGGVPLYGASGPRQGDVAALKNSLPRVLCIAPPPPFGFFFKLVW